MGAEQQSAGEPRYSGEDGERLRQILYSSNAVEYGSIQKLIELIQGAGFVLPEEPEIEYGWAPLATSHKMLPTEAEAREAYRMSIRSIRQWKRVKPQLSSWVPVEEELPVPEPSATPWEYGFSRKSWFRDGLGSRLSEHMDDAVELIERSGDADTFLVRRRAAGSWELLDSSQSTEES